MYFDESLNLISRHLPDKDILRILDRELAHAYMPGGHGYTEQPLLSHQTHRPQAEIGRLMNLYEAEGVVTSYDRVTCPCGEPYDPKENHCAHCGLPLSFASSSGVICYRVEKQPNKPSFDLATQSSYHKIFISYRHDDSEKLATDIYYSLRHAGYSVFLDNGSLPPGADAQQLFLNAASNAEYFIALISENYFASPYCKKEIAHASRKRRRLLRVNIPQVPSAPSDMPWINGPNWIAYNGSSQGLSIDLERTLLSAVVIPNTPQTISDLRIEACQFLLEQLSLIDIERVWNRLPWMQEIRPENTKPGMIRQIREATISDNTDVLCNSLAP